MEKYLKSIAVFFIIAVIAVIYHNKVINDIKSHEDIKYSKLEKVSDTQFRRIVGDSLTYLEMAKLIRKLEVENIQKPKIVTQIQLVPKEVIKYVDKLTIEEGKVYVEDYYPNKTDPFLKYTLNDSTSTFTFYPIDIALVLSQNKSGNWQVDTKMPSFINVTDIKANARPLDKQKNRKVYIGGGVNKKATEYSFEALAGFRIWNTIILGSVNTNEEYGVKTLYNF